ncbi:MAG: DinB family protein [Candidatus Geothermarchaeales archaeon]
MKVNRKDMTIYHLCSEIGPDGSTQIFMEELPGCYSRAPTDEEAIAKAPLKIKEHLDWLSRHGENVSPDAYEIETELSEEITGDWPVDKGDSKALFKPDLKAVTDREIERYLTLMQYLRGDLLELVSKIPEEAMEWKPNGETPRHIRRILEHIAEVEYFYMMRLRQREYTEWPLSFMELTRELTELRLRNLSEEERHKISYHRPGEWTERTELEGWTAKKAFRRFLWHERLHMRTIEKLLAQFLEHKEGQEE